MLSLSRTADYAIRGLNCLVSSGKAWTSGAEIARNAAIPRPYLAQVLVHLNNAGLILTKRGPRGGYKLRRPCHQISLLDVVSAVDGESFMSHCVLGKAVCSDLRACPMHEFWKSERDRIKQALVGISLADVAAFERKRARPLRRGASRTPRARARAQAG